MGRCTPPVVLKGRAFVADVLFDHLVNVVIPLKNINEMPVNPPVNLPKVGDEINFGTKLSAQKCLDDFQATKKEELQHAIKDDVKMLEEEGQMDAVE